ncbi:MAG: NDP-sugar synthase [Dehalococcoidia bacterium]|nr:NDP-sugar synthase [Dehalococcoidia bacterium]
MKAVILVGGKGTRLYPLTCNTPKAMVPILNKPFLEHMICYLKKYDVLDIVLAMGYLPNSIKSYFGDGTEFGVKITYLVEEKPLGTGGALKNAEFLLNEPFFVFNGDVLTEIDLGDMVRLHRETNPRVTIALTPVDNPSLYGVVETDARNMVKRFVEKPGLHEATTNMINAGIYIIEPEILARIPASTFFMVERELFPPLLEEGQPISSYASDAYWIDIGTTEKYLKVHRDLLSREKLPSPCHGLDSHQYISIENSSGAYHEARIEGPVLVGKDCTLGKNVQIKGPAVLGERCEIGENAIVEGAIVWHDSKMGKSSMLKNCIIASNCHIGDDCRIPDGCIMGDNVAIGKGSRLTPQTKVWPGNYLYHS